MDPRTMPTLIQRVIRRKHESEHSKGVDRLFEFDYMGASEFEFGTIPQALKAMRAAKDATWKVEPIFDGTALNGAGAKAYFVGHSSVLVTAFELFNDQLKPREERKVRPQEWTYMYETYNPDPKRHKLGPFHGWWILDGAAPFLLFKEKAHAEDWMGVL